MAELRNGARTSLDRELVRLYADTDINPFDAIAANNLAMKLILRGEYEKARKLLRRATRLDPGRQEIARNVEHVQRLIDQRGQLSTRSGERFTGTFDPVDVPFVANAWTSVGAPAPGSVGEPDGSASGAAGDAADVAISAIRLPDNPFDTRWLLERAALKSTRGDHRAALADLERARTLDPLLSGIDVEIGRVRRLLPDGGDIPLPRTRRAPDAGGFADDDRPLPRPWQAGEDADPMEPPA